MVVPSGALPVPEGFVAWESLPVGVPGMQLPPGMSIYAAVPATASGAPAALGEGTSTAGAVQGMFPGHRPFFFLAAPYPIVPHNIGCAPASGATPTSLEAIPSAQRALSPGEHPVLATEPTSPKLKLVESLPANTEDRLEGDGDTRGALQSPDTALRGSERENWRVPEEPLPVPKGQDAEGPQQRSAKKSRGGGEVDGDAADRAIWEVHYGRRGRQDRAAPRGRGARDGEGVWERERDCDRGREGSWMGRGPGSRNTHSGAERGLSGEMPGKMGLADEVFSPKAEQGGRGEREGPSEAGGERESGGRNAGRGGAKGEDRFSLPAEGAVFHPGSGGPSLTYEIKDEDFPPLSSG